MKGRRKSLSLAVVMIFFINMIIFGEVPDESVIIGSKGYSLKYAKEEKNVEEIREAIRSGEGRILVKKNNKWFLNDGTELDSSEVPEIIYKYYNGKESRFHKGDGEEITGFLVKEVKYAGGGRIHIIFSSEVSEESVLKKDNYIFKQKDDIGIRKIELIKANVAMIELEKLYFDNETVEILVKSGIKDSEGNTLTSEYNKFLEVNDYVKADDVEVGVKLKAPKLSGVKYSDYIMLRWDKISGADYYNLYRGTTGSAIQFNTTGSSITMDRTTGSNIKLYKSKIKDLWYKDQEIGENQNYIYSVRAVDEGVQGHMSNIVAPVGSSITIDKFNYRNTLDSKADTDNDGLINEEEYEIGTNVYEKDSDYDGIDDKEEILKKLNPMNSDTDGDGVYDGAEIELGTDPLKAEENMMVTVEKDLDSDLTNARVTFKGNGNLYYAEVELDDNMLLKSHRDVIGEPIRVSSWSEIKEGEILISFDQAEIEAKGIEKSDLSIYKLHVESGRAIEMESSIDGDRVKGKIDGYGTYVIGNSGLENVNLAKQDIVIGIDMSEITKEKDFNEEYQWKGPIRDIIQRVSSESRISIVENNTRIEEVQGFTSDKQLAAYGVEDMYYKEVSGESDIISLIETSKSKLEEKNNAGKTMILLVSEYDISKHEQVVSKLKEVNNAGAAVYIIGVLDEKEKIDKIKELNKEQGVSSTTATGYSRISNVIGMIKRNLLAFQDRGNNEVFSTVASVDNDFMRNMYAKNEDVKNEDVKSDSAFKNVTISKNGKKFDFNNDVWTQHNFHVGKKEMGKESRYLAEDLYFKYGHCAGIVMSQVLGYHGYLPASVKLNEVDLNLASMDDDFNFKKEAGQSAYNVASLGETYYSNLNKGALTHVVQDFYPENLRMYGYWFIRTNAKQNKKYWSENKGGYLRDKRVKELMKRIDEDNLIYATVITSFYRDDRGTKKELDEQGHAFGIYGYEIKSIGFNGAPVEIDLKIYEPNMRLKDHILKLKRKSIFSNKWYYEVEFNFATFNMDDKYTYHDNPDKNDKGIGPFKVKERFFSIFKSWDYFKDIEESGASRLSKVKSLVKKGTKEFEVRVKPFRDIDFKLYAGDRDVTSKYSVEVDRDRGIYKFSTDKNIASNYFAAVADVEYDEKDLPNIINGFLVWDSKFKDVDYDHWAYNYILESVYRDLVKGYDDGSFRPDRSITRAELLTLVMRGANVDFENYIPSNGEYVNPEHWAKKQINMAVEEGWINVQTGGGSLPNEKVTRDEVAGIVWRIFNSDKANDKGEIVKYDNSQLRVQEKFTDYYKIKNAIEVMQLQGNRVMEGFPDGEFKPQSYVTRAEICKILIKVLGE